MISVVVSLLKLQTSRTVSVLFGIISVCLKLYLLYRLNKTSLYLCYIDADAVLEVPEFTWFEGESVTLRCKHRTTRRTMTAAFYKNGSLIKMDTNHWSSTTGELTVRVSVSDEGRYKCQFADGTESEERELRVKGKKLSHCDDTLLF